MNTSKAPKALSQLSVSEIKYRMAEAAIAYEYVLLSSQARSLDNPEILDDVDIKLRDMKRTYLNLREQFASLDANDLISFEADLQLQKKIYFSAPNSVH
jgi:hypothetical protein